MVNFEWYRSFIAVYRAGTVTGAAQARFLTQPAISQQIAALESAVGQPLFQRTPRKMIPTEYGQQLYSRLAPGMDSLERASKDMRRHDATAQPVMRLGTPMEYFHEAGLEKLQALPLRLIVELGDAEQMLDGLSRGSLDAVIATKQIDAGHIDYQKIDQEVFSLVAPVSFELDETVRGSEENLEGFLLKLPWISYSADLPIIRRYWYSVFGHRPNIEPVMILANLLLIRKAVELGRGVSILPRYICRQSLESGRLKVLWEPGEQVCHDLWIATRRLDRNNREIAQLVSAMRGQPPPFWAQ